MEHEGARQGGKSTRKRRQKPRSLEATTVSNLANTDAQKQRQFSIWRSQTSSLTWRTLTSEAPTTDVQRRCRFETTTCPRLFCTLEPISVHTLFEGGGGVLYNVVYCILHITVCIYHAVYYIYIHICMYLYLLNTLRFTGHTHQFMIHY